MLTMSATMAKAEKRTTRGTNSLVLRPLLRNVHEITYNFGILSIPSGRVAKT
jgi:hypothetical protein